MDEHKHIFNHVADTANSIFASLNLFPAETVDFIPFFDNLKNLIQDKVILSFFQKCNGQYKLLFHTFQDPYFENDLDERISKFTSEHKSREIQLNEDTYLFAIKFGFETSNSNLQLKVVEFEENNYTELRELINTIQSEYEQLIPVIASFVLRARKELNDKFRQPISSLIEHHFDLNRHRYLNKIRELIGECIEDFENSQLIKAPLGAHSHIANLFAVIAYPASQKRCGAFNHTAQILLTRSQIDSINSWAGNNEYAKIIETPLSSSGRSISDTPFCTGFVEYSGAAGKERDSAGNNDDIRRQQNEEKLYTAITNSADHNVNFIPIFLNGCPWIVFYTLSKKESGSFNAWRHNYFIYRDVISKIGNTIRIKAKSTFFDIITDIIENSYKGVKDAQEYVEKVNTQLKQLSCFFPFHIPIMQLKNNVDTASYFLNKVEFPNNEKLVNNFWQPYLEYDSLNDDIIVKNSAEVLLNLLNQKETENKKRELSIASYGSAHFYGNWLGVMNAAVSRITNNIDELSEDCKNSVVYPLIEESILDLHDANNGMRGVTIIVDLLAKRNALEESHSPLNILESDSRFYTKDEISVNKLIKDKLSLKRIEPDIFLRQNLIIPDFLSEGRRPAKEFYENIILEILINYEKKSTGPLSISEIYLEGKLSGIAFKNAYKCAIGESSIPDPIEVNTSHFKGAILYCHLFLKEYGLGKIMFKKTCTGDAGLFEFQVILKHIANQS